MSGSFSSGSGKTWRFVANVRDCFRLDPVNKRVSRFGGNCVTNIVRRSMKPKSMQTRGVVVTFFGCQLRSNVSFLVLLACHALAFWTSSCQVTSLVNSPKRPTDQHTPRIAATLSFEQLGASLSKFFGPFQSPFSSPKRSPKWGLP